MTTWLLLFQENSEMILTLNKKFMPGCMRSATWVSTSRASTSIADRDNMVLQLLEKL